MKMLRLKIHPHSKVERFASPKIMSDCNERLIPSLKMIPILPTLVASVFF